MTHSTFHACRFQIICCTILAFFAATASFSQKGETLQALELRLKQYEKAKAANPDTYEIADTVQVNLLFKLYERLYHNDPARALQLADKSYAISRKIGYEKGMASGLNQQANIYDLRAEYDKALDLFSKSGRLYQKIGDKKGIAQVEGNIGVLYAKKGIHPEALRHMLEALTIGNQLKDTELILGANNNIALLFQSQNRYDEALGYFKKCLEFQRKHNMNFGRSYVCQNIADIYQKLHKDDIAKQYLEEGVKAAQAEHDLVSLANNYSSLGSIYMSADQRELAFSYLAKALQIREQVEDSYGIFASYTSLCDYYYREGNFERALLYANKAEALAKQNAAPDMQAEVYRQLYDIHREMGNFRLALDYHEKFKNASDSVFNSENRKKLTEQQLNFEFKNKQEARDRQAKQAIADQKTIRNLWIVALTLLALLAIYFLAKRYQRKSREKQLQFDEGLNVLQSKLTIQEAEALALRVENENIQLKNQLAALEAKREKEHLQEKLEFNQRELASTTLFLSQKNEMLSQLQQQIDELPKNSVPEKQMERIKSAIQNNRYMDADWEKFRLHFEQVHPDFFSDLEKKHPNLTTYELRLYAYLHMKLSTKEIAALLNIEPSSVTKAKVRLNKKLNQTDAGET